MVLKAITAYTMLSTIRGI